MISEVTPASEARPVKREGRIFVSIASYRDPECQHTIRDLFAKAADPDRISIGVCAQCDLERDADCFSFETRPDQVQQIVVHPSETKGMSWARWQSEEFYDGEQYWLQCDSHMRFCERWDERFLEMLAQAPSAKPILTTYPPGYALPNRLFTDARPRLLRARRFHNDQILRMRAGTMIGIYRTPIRSAFCSGCFVFADAAALRSVRSDPHLEQLFFGEEVDRMVRFWTHGFDFFAPYEHVIWHLWSREHRPLFWENKPAPAVLQRSQQRIRFLVGTEREVPPACHLELESYGLGAERSLQEYEEFSGVDFYNLRLSERAVYGGFPASFMESLG